MPITIRLASDERDLILHMIKNDKKIEAIKWVRTKTGADLVTAKSYVDEAEEQLKKASAPNPTPSTSDSLFIILYKWKEVDKDDYDDCDDLNEWKLDTDSNKESSSDYYLYPHALVRHLSEKDSEEYGVKGKLFYAVTYKFEEDDPYQEEYFPTKEEAFTWCEKEFGLTKVK